MKKIILASGSPRRKELLEQIGVKFEVQPSEYEEDMSKDMRPSELVKYLSRKKAEDVANNNKKSIVISADTIIAFKGKVLGKPKDKVDSTIMLKEMSDSVHSVFTGYTIWDTDSQRVLTSSVETKVFFKNISEKEIEAYVETGDPLDKAGAYAIQSLGAVLVEKIEGDFYNVMGLPISSLVEDLKTFEVDIFSS